MPAPRGGSGKTRTRGTTSVEKPAGSERCAKQTASGKDSTPKKTSVSPITASSRQRESRGNKEHREEDKTVRRKTSPTEDDAKKEVQKAVTETKYPRGKPSSATARSKTQDKAVTFQEDAQHSSPETKPRKRGTKSAGTTEREGIAVEKPKARRGRPPSSSVRPKTTATTTDINKTIASEEDFIPHQDDGDGSADHQKGSPRRKSAQSPRGSKDESDQVLAAGTGRRQRAVRSAPPTTNRPNKQTIRRTQERTERSLKRRLTGQLRTAISNLVRIPMEDKSETSKIYNPIITSIANEIKRIATDEGESDIFQFRKQLNSGSYFENLKVDTTNEFDIMFCIYGQDLVLDETEPSLGFVAVKLPKKNNSSLRNYLTAEGFLSPKTLLNRFRGLVEQAIGTLKKVPGDDNPFKDLQVELTKQRPGCPAVTLMVFKRRGRIQISIDLVLALEVSKPWPKCTSGWDHGVTSWLNRREIRAVKGNAIHLVAKSAPYDKDPDGNKLWRLSFSAAEKDIFTGELQLLNPTNSGGHATTCRKDCLKCLKYIKYKLQLTGVLGRNTDFASYHLKTVLLHAIARRPDGWENENIVPCLVYLIDHLVESIDKQHLPHFFIPGYNLFDPAVFDQIHLGVVKDQFLGIKEDLNNDRLPDVLNVCVESVH